MWVRRVCGQPNESKGTPAPDVCSTAPRCCVPHADERFSFIYPNGGQFENARSPARTPHVYAPWGARVDELAKSSKPPTRKILPLFFCIPDADEGCAVALEEEQVEVLVHGYVEAPHVDHAGRVVGRA